MAKDLPVVGVLGANGFIGSRIVELFHLKSLAKVQPIVRSVASAARSSRFALEVRVADGFDPCAVRQAVDGCDVVVHAIAGDRRTILGTLAPTYHATMAAGVRRLVYLSSASVHGQAPALGTSEDSALSRRQAIPYNNSKVLAERTLRRLRRSGKVEIVILRPGIVFGPRSYWTAGLADEILSGHAYFVGSGEGICNSIYVDNLVDAIYLAGITPSIDRHAFLVGDRETVTWRDLYRPIVESLGMELSQVPILPFPDKLSLWRDRIRHAKSSERLASLLASLPSPVRGGLISSWKHRRTRSPWERTPAPSLVPTFEKALLHRCQYKFPGKKAASLLGYEPNISFEDGCQRSVGWLAFAGYPVLEER